MKILVISDVHSRSSIIDRLGKKIHGIDIDLVLIAGDLTHFGTLKESLNILNRFKKYFSKVVFIPGNCDPPELLEFKDDNDLYNIHCRSLGYKGYIFYGIGGSNLTPFSTWIEYSEELLKEMILKAGMYPANKLIIVTHTPPYGVLDKILYGEHVGSKALRNFLEKHQPLLWITGHIHESRGVAKVGSTVIVNPGPLMRKYYALIELDAAKKPSVTLCRL